MMSDIVEKTLSSFHDLITGSQSSDEVSYSTKKSINLQNLIDLMTEVRTKHDADVAIKKELSELQEQLCKPGLKSFQMRDCLLRAIYCEMLGYSAPFVYIHAIKEADRTKSLVAKRIGYLAASLFLHEGHELVLLIVNTIQKDLKSTNMLEVCLALTASTYLIGSDFASTVLDRIEEKLTHPKELVRKKAILVLNHFLRYDTKNYAYLYPKLKSCIGDSDPEVVSVALNALSTIAKNDVSLCGDLVASLVEIQKQIIDRKLPTDFECHGVPSPWMQIDILRFLRFLGRVDDSVVRSAVRNVLVETLERLNVNDHNVAHAVVYECIRTVVTIANDDVPLLRLAFASVERFLRSNAANMKYMGLTVLAYLVRYVPSNVLAPYQSMIMECIRHTDSSVKRKALDVLFELTSSMNIQVTFPKMMEYLRDVTDEHGRKEIIERVSDLVDSYRPNDKWFLHMANTLLLEAGRDIGLSRTVFKIREFLDSGSTDDHVRVEAVTLYLDYLERRQELELSSQFLYLSIWTLGRCRKLIPYDKLNMIIGILSAVANESVSDCSVAACALTVLRNILVYTDCASNEEAVVLKNCLQSNDPDVRYRALEITRILKNLKAVRSAFSFETDDQIGMKNVGYDWTLSFADSFVIESLKTGGSPYKSSSLRIKCDNDIKSSVWPSTSSAASCEPLTGLPSVSSSLRTRLASVSSVTTSSGGRQSETDSLNLRRESAKNVWSEEGWCGGRLSNIVKQSASILSSNHVETETTVQNSNNSEDALAKALFGNFGQEDERTRENLIEDSSHLSSNNKVS